MVFMSSMKRIQLRNKAVKRSDIEVKALELPELAWYKNIISNDSDTVTVNEAKEYCEEDEECHDEEGCICVEPEIGKVRV
ncbi:unnamed protein product [Euphydryas editha]|uniref:Uncharacterized protein n=1 Tax=Euphydryas editha TaxID=104508 RepID=A0AAU9TSK2_EUPED|nr:unnamed protein product [Euphydryas editha]